MADGAAMSEVASDLYGQVAAARQTWAAVTTKGGSLLTTAANGIVESSFAQDPMNWGHLAAHHAVQRATLAKMEASRKGLLESIDFLVDELASLHKELRWIAFQVQERCAEAGHSLGKTCRLSDMSSMVADVVATLGKDLQCKKDVVRDLHDLSTGKVPFTSATHDALQLYLSVWSLCPLLDEARISQVETILLGEV